MSWSGGSVLAIRETVRRGQRGELVTLQSTTCSSSSTWSIPRAGTCRRCEPARTARLAAGTIAASEPGELRCLPAASSQVRSNHSASGPCPAARAGRFPFWGRRLLSEQDQTQFATRLEATKEFLESLQAFATPGQLRNFRPDEAEVNGHKAGLIALQGVEALQQFVADLGSTAGYLSQAEVILPRAIPGFARCWTPRRRS